MKWLCALYEHRFTGRVVLHFNQGTPRFADIENPQRIKFASPSKASRLVYMEDVEHPS